MNFRRITNMTVRRRNPAKYLVRRLISRIIGLVILAIIIGAYFLFNR